MAQLTFISLLPWKAKSTWIPCQIKRNVPHACSHSACSTALPPPLGNRTGSGPIFFAFLARCCGCIFSTSPKSLFLTPALQQKTCLSFVPWIFSHFCPSTPVPPARRAKTPIKQSQPLGCSGKGLLQKRGLSICHLLSQMPSGNKRPPVSHVRKKTDHSESSCMLSGLSKAGPPGVL